jgi:hypothetical protein
MPTATKTKLPTASKIEGVNHPQTGRPLYLARGTGTGTGIRVGKIGTKSSYILERDEVLYVMIRLPKSERRVLRKALKSVGQTALAATDVRRPA